MVRGFPVVPLVGVLAGGCGVWVLFVSGFPGAADHARLCVWGVVFGVVV